MAERIFDIEQLVEDAFLNVLGAQESTSGYTIKLWDDIENAPITPYVNVKATLTTELEGTYNSYVASNVMVDFGVFTSKRNDLSGRDASEIRADIRKVIAQTNIVEILNQTSGLLVYNNGIIPQQSFDTADVKLYQKGISVMVVCTTIDT